MKYVLIIVLALTFSVTVFADSLSNSQNSQEIKLENFEGEFLRGHGDVEFCQNLSSKIIINKDSITVNGDILPFNDEMLNDSGYAFIDGKGERRIVRFLSVNEPEYKLQLQAKVNETFINGKLLIGTDKILFLLTPGFSCSFSRK